MRNRIIASILALCAPGLGQIYANKIKLGIGIFSVQLFLFFVFPTAMVVLFPKNVGSYYVLYYAAIGFVLIWAISILLTIFDSRKHGVEYLPNKSIITKIVVFCAIYWAAYFSLQKLERWIFISSNMAENDKVMKLWKSEEIIIAKGISSIDTGEIISYRSDKYKYTLAKVFTNKEGFAFANGKEFKIDGIKQTLESRIEVPNFCDEKNPKDTVCSFDIRKNEYLVIILNDLKPTWKIGLIDKSMITGKVIAKRYKHQMLWPIWMFKMHDSIMLSSKK